MLGSVQLHQNEILVDSALCWLTCRAATTPVILALGRKGPSFASCLWLHIFVMLGSLPGLRNLLKSQEFLSTLSTVIIYFSARRPQHSGSVASRINSPLTLTRKILKYLDQGRKKQALKRVSFLGFFCFFFLRKTRPPQGDNPTGQAEGASVHDQRWELVLGV